MFFKYILKQEYLLFLGDGIINDFSFFLQTFHSFQIFWTATTFIIRKKVIFKVTFIEKHHKLYENSNWCYKCVWVNKFNSLSSTARLVQAGKSSTQNFRMEVKKGNTQIKKFSFLIFQNDWSNPNSYANKQILSPQCIPYHIILPNY